jgi:hypothetical protein
MSNSQPSKGYLIVASRKRSFLISAFNLIESIRDYHPEAKIALFAEQEWIDNEDFPFDEVDHLYPCGSWFREKLYGIANSPFDQTFYIDADCQVAHEDIATVHDRLDGHDMVFVELQKEQKKHFVEFDWDNGKEWLRHCGGVCLYDTRNPLVKEFINDWYTIFEKQDRGDWWPDKSIPHTLHRWDQFTLWWLIHKEPKYQSLKIKFFDDNYRWNYFSSFGWKVGGKCNYGVVDPVVIHYSAWMDKDGRKGYLTV